MIQFFGVAHFEHFDQEGRPKKLDHKIGSKIGTLPPETRIKNWNAPRGKLDHGISDLFLALLSGSFSALIVDPGREKWITRLEPKVAHELVRSLTASGQTLDFTIIEPTTA